MRDRPGPSNALASRLFANAPRAAIELVLAAATVAVYARVRHHAFISFDDRAYLFENPFVSRGLTPVGVAWAFVTLYVSNWHPLTWLSHMLDCQLFGLNAGWHHLVNVFWHVGNTILLMRLLDRMTGAPWRSALAAALFALHPLHVQSVAWVAERKDLMSTFFGLLCIWMYVSWLRGRSRSAYALVLGTYALSLMSKPMLVTLPFVLLLLDFWPLGRASSVSHLRLVTEKLPLFALSLASSAMTWVAQQRGGSMVAADVMPFATRLANAVISYADYIVSMFWPVGLAIHYPIPERIAGGRVAVSALLLLLVSAVAAWLGRKRPVLPVGWLWYLGTLVPVIGLVQVGLQAKADRYTYFPSIGIFLMIAWSLPALDAIRRSRAIAIGAAILAAIVALACQAYVEVGYWKDTVTIFNRTLAVTRDNYLAHDSKGYGLAVEKRWLDDAIAEYREALRIKPDFYSAQTHLADALLEKGENAEAVKWYRSVLEFAPERIHERQNLAVALVRLGRPAEAIPYFEAVLQRVPRLREAHVGLGQALERLDRVPEAIALYERALARRPADAELHAQLGDALAKEGRIDEATSHLREALRLRPGFSAARASLDRLEERAP